MTSGGAERWNYGYATDGESEEIGLHILKSKLSHIKHEVNDLKCLIKSAQKSQDRENLTPTSSQSSLQPDCRTKTPYENTTSPKPNRQDTLYVHSVYSPKSGKAPLLSSLDYFYGSKVQESELSSPQRNEPRTASTSTRRYCSASRVNSSDRSTNKASPVQLERLPLPQRRAGNRQHKMAAIQNHKNALSASDNLSFMTDESSQRATSSTSRNNPKKIELNVYDDSGSMTEHEVIELREAAARHFKKP